MDNLNYGIIGNCTSAAMISKYGSIDWCCLPRFDSSSVFAKLLDERKGGYMSFEVSNLINVKQKYIKNTNILRTIFTSKDGIFQVDDFMPRYHTENKGYYCPPDLIRYVRLISGKPVFRVLYDPKLEYAKYETFLADNIEHITAYTRKPYNSMHLYTDFSHYDILNKNYITLEKDHFLLVSFNLKLFKQTIDRTHLKYERTKVYWLNWADKTINYPKYSDLINRNALILKMLSYQKSGAIIAALTTSLPESIGDVRNWDYRYCWIRDGSMSIHVLSLLGHFSVADRYMKFLINMLPEKDEALQVMYGINGEKRLKESELGHLSGYKNSKPIRIGNAAYKQKQNDIYGMMLDAIYYYFYRFKTTLSYSEDLWTIVRHAARIVEHNWKRPDRGIWEIRNGSKHFTFSKVLCWTAIDRAKKMAILFKQDQYIEKWQKLADEIHHDIEKKAWSKKKQAFTQSYNSEDLDASVLLIAKYGFIDANDPRYVSTVKAIQKELEYKGLMFRYKNHDDFGIPSSAFTICSFWMIEALYMIGEKEAAEERFNKLLSYGNHLGLFSEDLDFNTKKLLGNFPQAYSHLAIIEIATMLSENPKGEENIKKLIKRHN